MISIKKFLYSQSKEPSDDAYERMAHLLLQAIGRHAVEGDRDEYDAFRAAMGELESHVTHEQAHSDVLVATGAAIKALQDYNRRTSLFIRSKSVELQIIVGMLTDAMGKITSTSQTSVTRLQGLQKQIAEAVMVEDMRTLKLRLSDCLESIQAESGRQQMESVRQVANLQKGLEKAQERLPDVGDDKADPLTGLRLRHDAEAAMQSHCEKQSRVYAALFVLERMQAINTRFGHSLGDQVLTIFRKHLARGLEPGYELFRWGPDSFLALLNSGESGDQIRRQLGMHLASRLEETFEIGSRSVTVPIAATWIAIPLFESSYSQILKKLDSFRATGKG